MIGKGFVRTFLALVLAPWMLAAAAPAARADIVLLKHDRAPGSASVPVRMSVAEGRVRIDTGQQTTIFRADRGEWIQVDGFRGEVRTAALASNGARAAYPDWIPTLPAPGTLPGRGAAFWRETAGDSTIAGLAVRHLVRHDGQGGTREIWVTRDAIGGGLYYRALESALAGAWGVSTPEGLVLPEGVPLRERVTAATRDGLVVVADVESVIVSDDFLAAAVFEAPDGASVARSMPRRAVP